MSTDTLSRIASMQDKKRIFISNVNGLLGHSLFEMMRNDYITITKAGEESHRFIGTLNNSKAGGMVTPAPSDAIKIIEYKSKPKTFVKQVKAADYIILDISQFGCDLEEAEAVIKALKSEEIAEKEQVLIVVSSPMVWSMTNNGKIYKDEDCEMRVPLPKY